MIKPIFRGEPTPKQVKEEQAEEGCKCGRCTRNDESSDSRMASSDLK